MKNLLFLIAFLYSIATFAGGFSVHVGEPVTASVTTTSALALAANNDRNYLVIQNNGTDSVIVKFLTVHAGVEGVYIAAGGNYEPIKGIRDAVYMKSVSGTQSVTLIEGE